MLKSLVIYKYDITDKSIYDFDLYYIGIQLYHYTWIYQILQRYSNKLYSDLINDVCIGIAFLKK